MCLLIYSQPFFLAILEKAIQNKDVTFSSFVIQACEYALRDMEDKKTQKTIKVDFFDK